MGVLRKLRKDLIVSGFCVHVFSKLIFYTSITLIFQKLFNSLATIMVVNDHMKHTSLNASLRDLYAAKSYEEDCVCSNNHIH